MKKTITLILILTLSKNYIFSQNDIKTICNPVDLSYRFCIDQPSRREAADPTIIWFKDRYWLFASKSGGYWYSNDLTEWVFIETNKIPVEEYAPTVVAIDDTLYFLASSNEKSTIYKTDNPLSDQWQVAVESLEIPVWDPDLFLDDDKRLYLYWGCSNKNPIYGVEIDYHHNFTFIGKPKELIFPNPSQNGWEVPGDYNTLKKQAPWIEGAWMNKINGKYFLQYAGPGTEFKCYADAVYLSDNPLGPFVLQKHNPFSYRPEGFIAGAGHGSTFKDIYGNYWHIATGTISVKHMFERRLVLFPVFLDDDYILYANTKFGDYPMILPKKKVYNIDEVFANLWLLSYKKNVAVSSFIDSLHPNNITDENIRTYWAAKTGDKGEYASIDLGVNCDVCAIQVNFAEHNTTLFGRTKGKYHRYIIEYSTDNKKWVTIIDKSQNNTDNTQNYLQLPNKINCRYIRIKNIEVPDGNFAISDLRIFGKGNGKKPMPVEIFNANRNKEDKRTISLTWNKVDNATGYIVSFGIDKNKLYNHYTLYGDTSVVINSLNSNEKYFFNIETFNENGITKSNIYLEAE